MGRRVLAWISVYLLLLGWLWPSIGYPNSPAGVSLSGKQIAITAGTPKLNRKSGAFEAKISLLNKTKPKRPLFGPLSLVITGITKPGVTLQNPDGFTPDGKPFRIVAAADSQLAPRKQIKGVVLRFDNPARKGFKARYAVFGLLAPNNAPSADAGTGLSAVVGQDTALNGTGSDPDGDSLTFRWTLTAPAGSAAALAAADTVTPHFVPDIAGDYTARLAVNDGIVDSAPATVSIHANAPEPGNSAPTARIAAKAAANKGDTVALDGGQSSDPDGNPLGFRWTLTAPTGSTAALAGATTATPSFKADKAGGYQIRLIVNDGKLDSPAATATVTVANRAPTANAGTDRSAKIGDTVALNGGASSDPDGDKLSYRWTLAAPTGSKAALAGATAAAPSFKPDKAGAYQASLIVNDGAVDSAAAVVKITVGNRAPTANAGTDRSATLGDTVSLSGGASSDPDKDALTYRWSLTGPAGSAATLAGANTATPTFIPDKAGDYQAQLIVNDGAVDSAADTVKITVAATIPPTVKITQPASLITVGVKTLTVTGKVNDAKATLTLNGAPVTVGGDGGFTQNVSLQEGGNVVVARMIDAKGREATDSISVSVDMTPPYVTIESVADGATVWTDTLDVSGQVNDIVRGTVAADQANVKVNDKAATVSNRSYSAQGVTLQEGENTIKVDASDAVGNMGHAQIKVTYKKPGAKHIELLSGDNQTGAIGTAVAADLKAKLLDEHGDPVSGQNVVFRVAQGDGTLGDGSDQAALVATDGDGVATSAFKLGTRAGTGNQRVRATAVGFDGEALFSASATTAAGNKVSINSGNNQRGGVGQPLPLPLVVAVTDSGANVVEGAQVEFKVTQGGGKFDNGQTSQIVATDSDGRASAELTLGSEEGLDVHRATATLVGTSLYAGFTASALKSGDPGSTSISGVVLDNQDKPLPKVTVRVDGTTRQAETDAQGHFKITEAPIGPVRLMVDGSTGTTPGEWPTLPFNIVTIAGAENTLPAPIYLVKLDTDHAVTVGDQDVSITLAEVPGFKLDVKAGSVTFPDGKKTGKLSVTPVNADKIPMPPPNGMQPQFIVTIQPVGAKFDPPARLTLPNVDGHKPGAQVEMYSFDHDLEEFVSIGLGTVSADGSLIQSNPGVGVIKAGWHCGSQPGGSGCCTSCGTGECVVQDSSCACKTLPNVADTPGDCQKPKDCKTSQPDDGDKPDDKCKTCNKGKIENVQLNNNSKTESYTYELPSEAVSKINNSLEALNKVGIIASVNLLKITGSLTEQDCCKDSVFGAGKITNGSVSGNFGGISVKAKIYPFGTPIPTFDPPKLNLGVVSFKFKAQFIAGVFANVDGKVSGTVGKKKSDCSDLEADKKGCFFANLNTQITPGLSIEGGGSASLTTDCPICIEETISFSASLVLGNLSWPFNISDISYNAKECGSGLSGGAFAWSDGSFKISASISGSYEAKGAGKVTPLDKSWDFLSCTINTQGVDCKLALTL